MASQTQPITTTDVLDYSGEAFFVGATFGVSPIMSRAGLTTGFKTSTANQFSMGNFFTGDAPAQDTQTEDASVAAMALTSFTPSQNTQNMQILRKTWVQSYAAQALNGNLSGVAVLGMGKTESRALATQRTAHLKMLMADFEFSALRGTSQAWTNAATAGAMGGVVTAIEAGSETAAGGAALSTNLINTEIVRMAAAGAEFVDPVITCGAFQYQALDALYGNAIQSQTTGGTNVRTIMLPVMGQAEIIYNPVLAADDLVILDMAHISPVFGVVAGKPPIFIEALAKIAAGTQEQLYSLASVDYNDVLFHGMVSGLATS